MIKFRPPFEDLSLAVKEEETFHTLDEMILSLFDRMQRIAAYIGAAPLQPEEIEIGPASEDDPRTGWRTASKIFIRERLIGFFQDNTDF